MRKLFIILALLILTSGFAFALTSVALAECPEGKTKVINVTPGGIKEICVPDHVAESGNFAQGNDNIVADICPCFSLEDAEKEFSENPTIMCESYAGLTEKSPEPCTYIWCYDSTGPLFEAAEGPDKSQYGSCDYGTGSEFKFNNFCFPDPENLLSGLLLTEAQANECIGILNANMGSEGDDCSNPFVILLDEKGTFTHGGDTTLATDDYQYKDIGFGAADLVYTFTPTKETTYYFTVSPLEAWDVSMYLVTDCNDIGLTLIDLINEAGIGQSEEIKIVAEGGKTYFLIIDGNLKTDYGSYSLVVSGPPSLSGP